MKIAVLGAGAMGCLYGCYLSRKHDVLLIDACAPQVDAINKNGVSITEKDGVEHHYAMKAVLSGTCFEPVDLLVVFVKSTATYAAMEANQALVGPETLVMTLQNGAGNDRDIARFVPRENIVIGTSKHNSVGLGLASYRHTGSGETTLGTMIPDSSRDRTVAAILEECGLETVVSDDIQRIIWSKLFVNMSINTLSALLECRIGYMIENRYAWDFAKRIIYEGVMVAEADGTYFDRREALESVHKVCEAVPNGYASMYQDRKNHRKTEIDKINGAVVEQAKLYGVPTPYNSLVVDLIHAVEGTYDEKLE
ncbi:2-dehydropantoate 2-reductase [uncultured Mailhella sp.]|uniref:ketopantoate reductase family protein n=1 Tax=uncultured Mailhella sp. TaxID=1981031 RepID=UPI00260F328E|nr:2-dehydropantoate 2-reductase [uncultured Mailhella sp.]